MPKNEIDKYISAFPSQVKNKLEEIRSIIKEAVPEAEEVISYKMPAYKLNTVLVYFAGYKNHVGFYPTSSGIREFQNEFGEYKWSKGAVQFPLDQPLPEKLITRMVKFRAKEDILRKAK
jgi:uncharacterized protein YdhG (YjbR/CyaY superfamily)